LCICMHITCHLWSNKSAFCCGHTMIHWFAPVPAARSKKLWSYMGVIDGAHLCMWIWPLDLILVWRLKNSKAHLLLIEHETLQKPLPLCEHGQKVGAARAVPFKGSQLLETVVLNCCAKNPHVVCTPQYIQFARGSSRIY
jgi:hypothetical protein